MRGSRGRGSRGRGRRMCEGSRDRAIGRRLSLPFIYNSSLIRKSFSLSHQMSLSKRRGDVTSLFWYVIRLSRRQTPKSGNFVSWRHLVCRLPPKDSQTKLALRSAVGNFRCFVVMATDDALEIIPISTSSLIMISFVVGRCHGDRLRAESKRHLGTQRMGLRIQRHRVSTEYA